MEEYNQLSLAELTNLLSRQIAEYTERYFKGESIDNLSSLKKTISDLIIRIENKKGEKS